ncbi:PD-(D/E)XK nuclease family protein [Chryseolinea sp. H1M3-3]|uniref:PD-(D/E)XK nuclease family protein n=1 Tax=Chryseolinea sp. H1M3-3 TaxID=3034144 RepID=UPI0023EB7B3E|nr:PD-(D/E)XK nuclease family protein [Chryseolinea sp. H1M3-3]
MKPFLAELAQTIYTKYRSFDKLTIVFPNRRAILYFRKHLSALLNKPTFAPKLVTIEDYLTSLSALKIPDKLELIHRLYDVYNTTVLQAQKSTAPEPFHQFYFWGEMLLRDFDEADKYLVEVGLLFKDLRHQKELDSSFDYLTEEQRKFLTSFWGTFEDNLTENKKKFLNVWNKLHLLYETYVNKLLLEGIAYEGMLQRSVAVKIEEVLKGYSHPVIFAGFNALTKAEEKIISYHIQQGISEVYWDVDEYYVNNNTQEAGKFFREYQDHPYFGKTFPQDIPSNFSFGSQEKGAMGIAQQKKFGDKLLRVFGAAQPVGQTKVMAQVLQEEFEKGTNPEDTIIVLPDENLLLPVLHSVSGCVEKLNVTMGFPIGATPVFNLIELLIELQINRNSSDFNHRQVLALMGHSYFIAENPGVSNAKRKEILSRNWVYIPSGYLASETPLHRLVFITVEGSILSYLRSIITEIGALKSINDFDKEYILHFIKLLNRMEDIMGDAYRIPTADDHSKTTIKQQTKAFNTSLRAFLRLFRQLVQSHRIPFNGEPLKGLQVMGVLETRNLDFKNVFILSLNEGSFPSFTNKSSYIPFSIRKAYGMPTAEHQDAMYAYLFYRMLQRAENVFLFYNTETDVLGQGESSRYLKQLMYESGLTIERRILHDPIQPSIVNPIVVQKDPQVIEALVKLSEGNGRFKGISPSALNTYIECRLRFYLRHVAKVREPDEVEEDLDARVLGNFLHEVMERFYYNIQKKKNKQRIEAKDFDNAEVVVDSLIDQVFIKAYQLAPGQPVEYEGQRLVVREVVKRFAHRILDLDKAYAPFDIEILEQGGLDYKVSIDQYPGTALISGKIDRVDRKDNLIRVIDYKTGKDKLDFTSIASLFSRDAKRNKAAFQTLLYALLYKSNTSQTSYKIVPGLINRMNLFDKNFKFGLKVGKNFVEDVEPLLPEFSQHLKTLVEDLYNPAVPFDQTPDLELCKFCPYQRICYR